jgi:hypothetical protein
MNYQPGDLFEARNEVSPLPRIIAHVVNDHGKWGKGFTIPLGNRYPWAEKTYRRWSEFGLKLGKVLIVPVERGIFVAHICAQKGVYSTLNPKPFRLNVFEQCLPQVAEFAFAIKAPVWMPKVGAGLGRGNWSEIALVIDNVFGEMKSEVTVFEI